MPFALKRKAPKWLDPPTLDEMETVEETDPMFLNVQIDMLNELISFEEFMQVGEFVTLFWYIREAIKHKLNFVFALF